VAYDEALVERVRSRLGSLPSVVELKMFGGWGVTIRGNMAVGVIGRDLIARVGPDRYDELLTKPGARPFDFTGRPMRGWLYVDGDAVTNGRSLNTWIDRGIEFASGLPPKAASKRRRP
jgi:TfoX/Sxy family transcriptional regulator of competence genes